MSVAGKTQIEARSPAQAPPVAAKQPDTRKGPVSRLAQSGAPGATNHPLPPPDGTPAVARAAGLLTDTAHRPGAVSRSRMAAAMQGAVGNARLNRMLGVPVSASRPGDLVNPAAAAPTRTQSPAGDLTVSHPDSPAEREAEAVARHVTAGRPAPRIMQTPSAGGTVRRQPDDEQPAAAPPPAPPPEDHPPQHAAPESASAQVQPAAAGGGPAGAINTAPAAQAIAGKGAGSPLPPATRGVLEGHMGADLSAARIHSEAGANRAAGALNARAFTPGSDIYLGHGESPHDTGLMAHELTHVVQNTATPATPAARLLKPAPAAQNTPPAPAPQPGTKQPAAAEGDIAPGVLDLKGNTSPFDPIAGFLDQHPHALVNVRFGQWAEGQLHVEKHNGQYEAKRQPIPLSHPLFAPVRESMPNLAPSLILAVNKGQIEGYISLAAGAKVPDKGELPQLLQKAPDLLGLAGFDFESLPKITNTLEGGVLRLELAADPIRLGSAFSGTIDLKLANEKIEFSGSANVAVGGLAEGTLSLERSAEGLITGKASVAVNLKKNVTGNIDVAWDGRAVTGEGKVGYQGEKLSGQVTLRLMEKSLAEQMAREKQAPPAAGETAKPGAAPAAEKKPKKVNYVVFGEGDLTFSFTEWLTGTAHVIVDHEGFLTVIGKITPQKEVELFPQKDYVKQLFKVEARAAYGIPVVGNIFVFGNVGMDAFAKLGPAKLYNIVVQGTYSTDPKKLNDFSIQASFNLSAAAGLRLRGEAGVGLEILAHDIKAGAGINGIVAIQGYAEATPIIGYREKAKEGEDKKGEFFIRGEVEIAAKPLLGLSGDLFVEIDAPWWSPVPDKKWTWELGSKEWPIGGGFGIKASVDYVLGSKELPTIEFQPVDFSADKFMTDLYHDKTQPKAGEGEAKKAPWAEKNSPAAEPPAKGGGKGEHPGGKAPDAKGAPAGPKAKAPPGAKAGGKKDADPNAKTAEGKSVKQLKAEAGKQGKKPKGADGKQPGKGAEKTQPAKDKGEQTHDAELKKGVAALDAVTQRYAKDGATKEEVVTGVKSVRRKFKVFKSLEVIDGGKTWNYEYEASPKQTTIGPPQHQGPSSKSSQELTHEGTTGPFAQLDKAARAATKERNNASKAAGKGLVPSDQVLTAHHIPQQAILEVLSQGKVNRTNGAAVIMTMAEHINTVTYGTKGTVTKAYYLGELKKGRTPASVFKEALDKDLSNLKDISPGNYDKAANEITNYYMTVAPELMSG
jgi:hypothetical protein